VVLAELVQHPRRALDGFVSVSPIRRAAGKTLTIPGMRAARVIAYDEPIRVTESAPS